MKKFLFTLVAVAVSTASAATEGDYLIKVKGDTTAQVARMMLNAPAGTKFEDLGGLGWVRVTVPKSAFKAMNLSVLKQVPGVVHVQPNYKISLQPNQQMAKLRQLVEQKYGPITPGNCNVPDLCAKGFAKPVDNPPIPAKPTAGKGNDPLFGDQWGMMDIGVREAWKRTKGLTNIVVAVIDTGVDYTHEDLLENMWRNPGETGTDADGKSKATNGIDDDGNGYIDDVMGYDFAANDQFPYDLAATGLDIFTGGNPGHGTHCAGNVAARGFNGKGIAGVAPNVSIMAVRFLSEKGQGTTGGAVQSILYAVNNGAQVLSNSWGSEGEDPADPDNQALKDAIAYAEQRGSLFVAAAGNGHNGVGYDNDSDAKPAYPASYDNDIIVSVAALDALDGLGSFSNWGRRSVDIGAPGVKVFSTTVGSKYADTVFDFLGMKVTWDGTSMATPHVAGAAALYLSNRPSAPWQEVKDAILRTATPIPTLSGKAVSEGKLNVEALLNY